MIWMCHWKAWTEWVYWLGDVLYEAIRCNVILFMTWTNPFWNSLFLVEILSNTGVLATVSFVDFNVRRRLGGIVSVNVLRDIVSQIRVEFNGWLGCYLEIQKDLNPTLWVTYQCFGYYNNPIYFSQKKSVPNFWLQNWPQPFAIGRRNSNNFE